MLIESRSATPSAGEGLYLIKPRIRSNATRGIVFRPGAGGTAELAATYTGDRADRFLVSCGAPYAWVDAGDPYSFGNDASIAAFDAAVDWFLTNVTPDSDGKIVAHGGSMGAIVVLNWARAHPAKVAAVVLAAPLLDLATAYEENPFSLRDEIGAAYGVTYPTPIPGLSTHSPVEYPDDVTFPVGIWSSAVDTIASDTAECLAWAAQVGPNVQVTTDDDLIDHNAAADHEGVWEFVRSYL